MPNAEQFDRAKLYTTGLFIDGYILYTNNNSIHIITQIKNYII